MRQFKAELFDREFNFISWSYLIEVDLKKDYITLEDSTVVAINNGHKGNQEARYIRVLCDGYVDYEGIIVGMLKSEKTTEYKCKDLNHMLDFNIYAQEPLSNKKISSFLQEELTKKYIDNEDELQRVPGLKFHVENTINDIFNNDKGITNLHSKILEWFQQKKLILKIKLNIDLKKIDVFLERLKEDVVVVESKLHDVLDMQVTLSSSTSINKIIYYNSNSNQNKTYYLKKNNIIESENATNRILPIQETLKEMNVDVLEFDTKTFEDAQKTMHVDEFGNLIELLVNRASKIIKVGDLGTKYKIIDNDFEYNTILTAKKIISNNTILLTFGMVRFDLTQILALERKKYETNSM